MLTAVEGARRGAAARFGILAATAVRWVRRWREAGERPARCQDYLKQSVLDPHLDFVLALVEKNADITLDKMRARTPDWYKKAVGVDAYTPEEDPGVRSVRRIYNYYKSNGIKTVVMGALFRNPWQIKALA